MSRRSQALALICLLAIVAVGHSCSPGISKDENWVIESVEPPTDTIKQGENFTLKVSAYVNQSKVDAVRISASVIYPFMEILEADYTINGTLLVGPVYNTTLNFTRDTINFSTFIMPPANFTITAKVFCSIAGSFYIPTASLWVCTLVRGDWTEYKSNRVGPLTIVARVEALKLDELQADVAAVKEALSELADELKAARAELQDLKAQGERLRHNIGVVNATLNRVEAAAATLNTKVDTINTKVDNITAELRVTRGNVEAIRLKLETDITWELLTAIALIAVTCIGAWLAVMYARKKPSLST